MPIRVQCSGCKTALAVKDHLAGKRVKCPKCQAPLAVPNGSAPTTPRPTPKTKPPVRKQEDLEALAAAALGDEPAKNGNGSVDGVHGSAVPAADAPIKFTCEYCDSEIEMPYDEGGKKAPCPECRHIIKVPMPKIEKPKDWRTVEKKGPSLAAMNQPVKIENAWGTETKARVSQAALLDAGVIAKPTKPSIGLSGWIERGVKGGLLLIVVGGLVFGLWKLRQGAVMDRQIEQFTKECDSKWPAVIQGEYHIGLANLALRQPKQREAAREQHISAWQKVAAAATPGDKIDRDCFLIQLAKAQISLGGEEMEIREGSRFDWDQEVMVDLQRTVNMIENPDAKVTALRELAMLLEEKKRPELSLILAGNVASSAPQAKAFQLALYFADANKPVDAGRLAKMPAPGKGVSDFVARCGYAEALARKDECDKAIELALAPGDLSHKYQALIAIAGTLDVKGDKGGNLRRVCEAASKLVEKEPRPNVPGWVLLQHVRFVARFNADEAKELSQKLPAGFSRRGQLEIALASLAKSPLPANAEAMIQELDKEGPGRGLAWQTLARSKVRANQTFAFTPDGPDDEILASFLRAAQAFAVAENN